MKKIFLSMGLLTLLVSVHAQTSGTVTYDRVTDRWRRITDEQMRAMIPQTATAKFQLVFSDSISVYKLIPDDNTPDPFASNNGPRLVIRNPGDNAVVYRNIAEMKQIEQRELGDNTYLILDTLKQQPWKLTGETKTILGHVCKKATMENTVAVPVMRTMTSTNGVMRSGDTSRGNPAMQNIEITAWYAEDVPSPVGPGVYASLPGLILQVDVNKGETVFTATAIKPTADKKELAEPKKGKKIARADFLKKQNEMMSNFQGGNIRIGG